MIPIVRFAAVLFLVVAGGAVPPGAAVGEESPAPSPYAGLAGRDIKALSPEQIVQYLEGHGMGLALPAELNGYPGPKHVLELAEPLGLTDDQKAGVQRIYDTMHERAVDLGREVVAGEAEMDSLFAAGVISDEALRARLDRLAALQGALRHAHLRAHLQTKEVLTAAQAERYGTLRGYGSKGHDRMEHHGHGRKH